MTANDNRPLNLPHTEIKLQSPEAGDYFSLTLPHKTPTHPSSLFLLPLSLVCHTHVQLLGFTRTFESGCLWVPMPPVKVFLFFSWIKIISCVFKKQDRWQASFWWEAPNLVFLPPSHSKWLFPLSFSLSLSLSFALSFSLSHFFIFFLTRTLYTPLLFLSLAQNLSPILTIAQYRSLSFSFSLSLTLFQVWQGLRNFNLLPMMTARPTKGTFEKAVLINISSLWSAMAHGTKLNELTSVRKIQHNGINWLRNKAKHFAALIWLNEVGVNLWH